MIPLGIIASSIRVTLPDVLLEPTDIAASLIGGLVKLTWTDRNTNETGHRIYRSSSLMDTQALPPPVAELGPDVTEWEDTDTPVDHMVYYIVSAVRGAEEAFSDEVMIDTTPTEEDPYWDNVAALLHFDGESGDTSITDERGSTWQVFGNASLQDINPRFGETSLRVDGLGDYIQTNSGLPESSDFTAEAWVYLSQSKPEINIFSQLHPSGTLISGRCDLGVKNGYIVAFFGGTGYPGEVITDLAPPLGSYFHVAFCRNGPDFYVALDGQVRLAFSSSRPLASVPFRVCRASSTHTGRDLNGYVDELRITNGVARYTANFTPPTSPFPNS